MAKSSRLWFRRKTYGWGWTPVTWQGWTLTLCYIALLVLEIGRISSVSNSPIDTINSITPEFIFFTGLIVVISYIRGEKPRWQWRGKPAKPFRTS